MNQNLKNSSRVLTEGFFKTRVRRPVIWEVKRAEANVSADDQNRADCKNTLVESDSESDSTVDFAWKKAA